MNDVDFQLILISIAVLWGIGISLIIFASNRFLGQFWARFHISHVFTLLQLFTRVKALIGLSLIVLAICLQWFLIGSTPFNLFACLLFGLIVLFGFYFSPKSMSPNQFYLYPANVPTLKFIEAGNSSSPDFLLFEKGFAGIYHTLGCNLIPPVFHTKSWFSIPGSKYPSAYLWDSSFISGAWRLWDARIAQEILRPFLDFQREDGMCPQTVLLGAIPNYQITNPPLLAFGLVLAAEQSGDFSIPVRYFDRLVKFTHFIESQRQDQGLFKWFHSYESGIDNSPRFTNQSESVHYDLTHLWTIDFNVWMVMHYRAMQVIAEHAHKSAEMAEFHSKEQALIQLIQTKLWDSKTGLFYDYDYQKQEFVKIRTIFSTLPLYLAITTPEQSQQILAHLRNPNEFNTTIPFPTVARDDPTFQKDTWRGPVWLNTAWISLQGTYHVDPLLGAELAYRLVKGVYSTYKNCGSFYEFYDPDEPTLTHLDRKKGNFFKKITLGEKPIHHFCGWTALTNTILIENILGYHRKKQNLEFHPHLPREWLGVSIDLTIPQYQEKIHMKTFNSGEIHITIESTMDPLGNPLSFKGKNHTVLNDEKKK